MRFLAALIFLSAFPASAAYFQGQAYNATAVGWQQIPLGGGGYEAK
jgi:hypothetical protein